MRRETIVTETVRRTRGAMANITPRGGSYAALGHGLSFNQKELIMNIPVTITREEIAKANDEAVALADKILKMSVPVRMVFMERLYKRLDKKLCLYCFYPQCRCPEQH